MPKTTTPIDGEGMRPKDVARFIGSMLNEVMKEDGIIPPAIHLWGPPGIGKSSVIRQVAESKGVGYIDLRLALMDPTDLRGIPVPQPDGTCKWLQPSFLPRPSKDESEKSLPHCQEYGILFLDELNLAPPLVQSSAYQLVLDRAIGEYHLPDGWIIIAAGNRAEHGAHIYKMAMPLRNRFIHLNFRLSHDDWTDWAINNFVNPDVIGFMQFRSDLLFQMDEQRRDDSFPTPRSWVFVSDELDFTSPDLWPHVIEGAVGRGACYEFMAYLRVKDQLPNIDKIFAGDDIVPKARDQLYALVTTLAVRADMKQFERLLQYSFKLDEEFAVLMVKMMGAKDKAGLQNCPTWSKWARKFKDIIL